MSYKKYPNDIDCKFPIPLLYLKTLLGFNIKSFDLKTLYDNMVAIVECTKDTEWEFHSSF